MKFAPYLPLPSLAVVCLASIVGAQANLLKNGDFESSRTSIAPWKISGFAENPTVEQFRTNGATKSNAYAATWVGGKAHSLEQDVKLTKGKSYVLGFDGHATATWQSGAWTYLVVETRSGKSWTAVAPRQLLLSWGASAELRSYAVTFSPKAAVDAIRVTVTLDRPSAKRRVRFDNFELRERDLASLLYSPTNRAIGSSGTGNYKMTYALIGEPGLANVVFVGSKTLPGGVRVPGFTNRLFLDPGGLLIPFLTLVTDQNGVSSAILTFPRSMLLPVRGLSLYYQPITLNQLRGVLRFGGLTNLAFTK